MTEDKDRPARGSSPTDEGDVSEEEIDEALLESFPASDPPAWTLGTDHKQKTQSEPQVKESAAGGTAQEK